MALIDTDMVKVEKVFLPYLVDKVGVTLFERLKEQQFLLPSSHEKKSMNIPQAI